MKRDMNLARSILFKLEKRQDYVGFTDLEIEGYSSDKISYHVMLLSEAGLIEAMNLSTHGGPDWRAVRLTWDGHEFLETSRDESRWKNAIEIMTKNGGGLAFEVLKLVLSQLMKNAVLGPSVP